MDHIKVAVKRRDPWNKGKLVGQKSPLKLKEIWAIRIRLQLASRIRDLALFNLAIDSKLRACDLVKLRVRDVSHGDRVSARTIVMQQKTQRPVQFVRTNCRRMGAVCWTGPGGLRHAHVTAHQGIPDLPPNEELAGRSAAAGPHEDGKHGQILGHRSR